VTHWSIPTHPELWLHAVAWAAHWALNAQFVQALQSLLVSQGCVVVPVVVSLVVLLPPAPVEPVAPVLAPELPEGRSS